MYKKIGMVDLIKAIQDKVQGCTGLKCYDAVPKNAVSPFYFIEIVGARPSNSKTMFREIYNVWIHWIAEPNKNNSSVSVYNLIKILEESLTEDIILPDSFDLIMQTDNGIQVIKTDETNEKHAVIAYEFMVGYGFKCKI